MLKHFGALALGMTLALPVAAKPAATGQGQLTLVTQSASALPPANYRGQWWTTPDNCQYSRAGRPGETVWYLIVNTAHEGCKRRLIQRAFSDYK